MLVHYLFHPLEGTEAPATEEDAPTEVRATKSSFLTSEIRVDRKNNGQLRVC